MQAYLARQRADESFCLVVQALTAAFDELMHYLARALCGQREPPIRPVSTRLAKFATEATMEMLKAAAEGTPLFLQANKVGAAGALSGGHRTRPGLV